MKSSKALRETEELKSLKMKLEIVKMECKKEKLGLEKLKAAKGFEVSKLAKAIKDLTESAYIFVIIITIHWDKLSSWFKNHW